MVRLVLPLLMLFLAFPAHAVDVCTCRDRDLNEDIYGSFAIFSGTVKGIRREFNPDRTRVEFNVHASWVRVKTKEYAVYTQGTDLVAKAREGITCGYKFQQGETYLVYAYRDTDDHGYPWVSSCGHTKKLAAAAEDMGALGQPVRIFDTPEEPYAPRDFTPTPLPEATPLPGVMENPKPAEKNAEPVEEFPEDEVDDEEDMEDSTIPPELLEDMVPETGPDTAPEAEDAVAR